MCRRFQSLKEAAVRSQPHTSLNDPPRPALPTPALNRSMGRPAHSHPTCLAQGPATLPLPSGRSVAATPGLWALQRGETVGVGEVSFPGWGWGRFPRVTPLGTPIYAPPALRTLGAEEEPRGLAHPGRQEPPLPHNLS